MVVTSLVETARSERLKKHLCIPGEDEYQCSSGPLNDFVLLSVLQSIPSQAGLSKRKSRTLKPGYVADLVRNASAFHGMSSLSELTVEGGVSPSCLILGLIYIQRLATRNPAYMATIPPRKLFLIAMVVASKYLNDEGEMEALTNSEWASIGSVPKSNLDILERNFLSAMDWQLYVSLEEFYSFVNSVEGSVAMQQAMKRGWLSYTDLVSIWSSSDDYMSMLQHTAKVAFTGATLYLMCVSTLLAAVHSFCSESATPTGPPSLPTSSSTASLSGFPLDNSPSPVWTSNSSSPVISASAKIPLDTHDGFDSSRLLLAPTQLPQVTLLARSLLWPDPGPASYFKSVNHSVSCSSRRTTFRIATKSNDSLASTLWSMIRFLKVDYKDKLLKTESREKILKPVSHEMTTKNGDNEINSKVVHRSVRSPINSMDFKRRYHSPLHSSPSHAMDVARVEVAKALELGYNHKGTFHWDPLLNTSMSTETKLGTFGVLFRYFLNS